MNNSKLILHVNNEQKEDLLGYINSKHWNINITEECQDENVDKTEVIKEDINYPMPQHVKGESECPHCLCSPCIVSESRRQRHWWPAQNQPPSPRNNCARKPLYRRFWAVMFNCGAWRDPRYLEKKAIAHEGSRTWHRREIMPDCVVKMCRQWLPNTPEVPYIGHTWE